MPTARAKMKASKNPPDSCGGLWDMRCMGPSTQGKWRCSVKRPEGGHNYACAGAVVDGRKGMVRFYD
jgi:hypothetical protein